MEILASGLLGLIAFLIHVAWWRIKRPKATGRAITLLFLGTVLFTGTVLTLAGRADPVLFWYLPAGLTQWLQVEIVALAITAAYIATYPAIEVPSPTLLIIELLALAGARGISKDEFYDLLGDDLLATPRIADLLSEGLATEAGGRYILTPQGRGFSKVFTGWRAILRADKGG